MSISNLSKKTDMSDTAVSNFLKGPKKSNDNKQAMLERMNEEWRDAVKHPDKLPGSTAQQPVQTEVLRTTVETKQEPLPPVSVPQPQSAVTEDSVSLAIPPQSEARAAIKPETKKNKTEKSFSLDGDIYRHLVRLSNHEGLRLDRNVSTSEIMRHLMDFALAHVKGNVVIPTPDGSGLHIPGSENK